MRLPVVRVALALKRWWDKQEIVLVLLGALLLSTWLVPLCLFGPADTWQMLQEIVREGMGLRDQVVLFLMLGFSASMPAYGAILLVGVAKRSHARWKEKRVDH